MSEPEQHDPSTGSAMGDGTSRIFLWILGILLAVLGFLGAGTLNSVIVLQSEVAVLKNEMAQSASDRVSLHGEQSKLWDEVRSDRDEYRQLQGEVQSLSQEQTEMKRAPNK